MFIFWRDGVFGWNCFSSIIRYDYDLSLFGLGKDGDVVFYEWLYSSFSKLIFYLSSIIVDFLS